MVADEQKEMAKIIKDAFGKQGIDLDMGTVEKVLAKENCGSCWNIGCKDGCSGGCLSSCKSGNA